MANSAGAEVIELGKNTGFSHAVNCGIQSAGSGWIAVMNNDVAPQPDWLAKLMDQAELANAWFAAGKLLDARDRDRIDGAFDAICRGACAWRCGHGRPDSSLWNQPREICFAPFTAALFRWELFQEVGLLDEDFESYLEDIDFGIRCAAVGRPGIYVPEAVAYHQGGDAQPLASRHSKEKISKSTSADSETLSAAVDLKVWLAGLRRPGSVGNCRATPRGCCSIPERQIGGHAAISIGPRKISGQPSGYRRAQ